jgi:hypothetical protein
MASGGAHDDCRPARDTRTLEFKINLVPTIEGRSSGGCARLPTSVHDGGRIATAEARLVDASGVLYAHATGNVPHRGARAAKIVVMMGGA